jgi:hypothetical protein
LGLVSSKKDSYNTRGLGKIPILDTVIMGDESKYEQSVSKGGGNNGGDIRWRGDNDNITETQE